MYVAKFLALNLELDPPDCTGLGEDPEDVSMTAPHGLDRCVFDAGKNRRIYWALDRQLKHAELPRLDREARGVAAAVADARIAGAVKALCFEWQQACLCQGQRTGGLIETRAPIVN